jgi:hypothetical protein
MEMNRGNIGPSPKHIHFYMVECNIDPQYIHMDMNRGNIALPLTPTHGHKHG